MADQGQGLATASDALIPAPMVAWSLALIVAWKAARWKTTRQQWRRRLWSLRAHVILRPAIPCTWFARIALEGPVRRHAGEPVPRALSERLAHSGQRGRMDRCRVIGRGCVESTVW